jgi:hypothetical protein
LLKYKEIKKNMNTEFEYIKIQSYGCSPSLSVTFEATAAAHDKPAKRTPNIIAIQN